MDAVLRAIGIYVFLLVLFRIAGRRSLAEMTAFDFVLLLIIGEATQQALLGDDFSVTNAAIVITTLIGLEMAFDAMAIRSQLFAKITSGVPMVLVENGRPLERRMRKARVTVDDVLQRARETRGIERLDQIKFAVLEASGGISIIPIEAKQNF
jgi:uncharacterized membrane protein YcaP (DUF421 family)